MRSLRDMGGFYQHAPEVSIVSSRLFVRCPGSRPKPKALDILNLQPVVRTHAATHMPLPPDSCGHKDSSPLGGDPGTNGLLTANRSTCEHRCSNPCTTPVVSKSAKVHAAYTSFPPGLTAAAACRSIRC